MDIYYTTTPHCSEPNDGFVTYVDLDTNCYYSYSDAVKEVAPTFWDALIVPTCEWAMRAVAYFRPLLPRKAALGRLSIWSSRFGCTLPGLRVPGY